MIRTRTAVARCPDFAVDRALVDRELDSLLPEAQAGDIVAHAMRYSVLGGAQRIRPILSLRVARFLNAESPAVLRAAAAAELVHCASLIVDDLPCMDDANARRGRPSVHVEFGEATAILTAFALVALAARCTMDPIVANGSAARLAKFQWMLLGVLDAGSLIKGQILDLTELKTAPLFELAVEAGGVSSPDYDRREPELRRFARQFGMAFQTADDFMDGDGASAAAALREVARAREMAAPFDSGIQELVEYLHAKITQDRRNR